jgi:hypothetical protein
LDKQNLELGFKKEDYLGKGEYVSILVRLSQKQISGTSYSPPVNLCRLTALEGQGGKSLSLTRLTRE